MYVSAAGISLKRGKTAEYDDSEKVSETKKLKIFFPFKTRDESLKCVAGSNVNPKREHV